MTFRTKETVGAVCERTSMAEVSEAKIDAAFPQAMRSRDQGRVPTAIGNTRTQPRRKERYHVRTMGMKVGEVGK
ncbi:hypothetical protein LBMAG49_24690 [Planctomycetota bacterium]|nr:hypothetical protein LBMAG49_24690 [Planctomycetota bacterium]